MNAGKPSDISQDQYFSPERIALNTKITYSIRILISFVFGCAAGILGIHGLMGIVAYLINYALISFIIYFKSHSQPQLYFSQSFFGVIQSGFFDGALTFTLFWTLFYNMVHIY